MLGSLWLLQPHLDSRSADLLVAIQHTQLCLRSRWLRPECRVPAKEFVSCIKRDGQADQ
jgi:hypothetical protein